MALLAMGAASPAGAVSLTMQTDKPVYDLGDDIVITITADTTTSEAMAEQAFVSLVYDQPALVDGVGAVAAQSAAITSFSGAITWGTSQPACTATGCVVIDQFTDFPLPPDPAIIIGTLAVRLLAYGVLTISADSVSWFGAAAPQAIEITLVPEPATATLLAGGLLGLALRARSR